MQDMQEKTNSQQVKKIKFPFLTAIAVGLIASGLFCTSVYVFAVYGPGETLSPSCAPGTAGCTVKPPLTDSFTNDFAGTGDITTTGSFRVKNNNTYQYFGANDEAKIYFDGTNLVLDPSASVGANILTIGGTSVSRDSYTLKFNTSSNPGTIQYTGSTKTFDFTNLTADAIVAVRGLSLKNEDGGVVYALPTTDGGANQYLKTDGNGVLSWATVDSGVPYTGASQNVNLGNYSLISNYLRANNIYNVNEVLSIDLNNTRLYNQGGLTYTVDWNSGALFGNDGENSLSWTERALYDGTLPTPTVVFDWGNRILKFPNNNTAINFATNGSVDFGSSILKTTGAVTAGYFLGDGSNLTGSALSLSVAHAGHAGSADYASSAGSASSADSANYASSADSCNSCSSASYASSADSANYASYADSANYASSAGSASSADSANYASSVYSSGISWNESIDIGAYDFITTGTVTAFQFIETSSLRFKQNVRPVEKNFLDILQLEPKTYELKKTGKTDIGYIAEDLDALGFHELVSYDSDGLPAGINYSRISLYLAEVVKQQQIDINALKQRAGINVGEMIINQAGSIGEGQISSVTPSSVSKILSQLGMSLADGVAKFKGVFADRLVVKTARINKMEMVDDATGEIYCAWIQNGEWQKIKGECSPSNNSVIEDNQPATFQEAQVTSDQIRGILRQAEESQRIVERAEKSVQNIAKTAENIVKKAQNVVSDSKNVVESATNTITSTATPMVIEQATPMVIEQATPMVIEEAVKNLSPPEDKETIVPQESGQDLEIEPAPQVSVGSLIQNAAAGLINSIVDFTKWIFGTPVKKVSSMPQMKSLTHGVSQDVEFLGASLLKPIINLFNR